MRKPVAHYSGATSIAYVGKSITYRSAGEMRAAIIVLKRELGIAPPTHVRIIADKDW